MKKTARNANRSVKLGDLSKAATLRLEDLSAIVGGMPNIGHGVSFCGGSSCNDASADDCY